MKGTFVLLAFVGFLIVAYSFLGRVKTASTTTTMNSELTEIASAHNVKFTDQERQRQVDLGRSLQGLWTPVSILGVVTFVASCAGYYWGSRRP